MTPANVNPEKIEDPEKQALASADLTTTTTTTTSFRSNDTRSTVSSKSYKMSRTQKFICSVFLLALVTLTIVSASPALAQRRAEVSAEERARFQELLNTIEPSSLHNILHKHLGEKYQHGVYQEDKTAMDVVHQSNSDVAHSLIELAKRQAGNGTTTSTTQTQTTTTSSTSSIVSTPTNTEPSVTSSTTTTLSNTPTTSTTTTSSTTTHSSSSTTVTSTSTSTSVSSTNVNTPSTTSTSVTTPSTTRSVTQQTIYTTTYADGAISTVTSITVVGAVQGEQTGAPSKTNSNASLQTNGAASNDLRFGGVLGAFGMALVAAL